MERKNIFPYPHHKPLNSQWVSSNMYQLFSQCKSEDRGGMLTATREDNIKSKSSMLGATPPASITLPQPFPCFTLPSALFRPPTDILELGGLPCPITTHRASPASFEEFWKSSFAHHQSGACDGCKAETPVRTPLLAAVNPNRIGLCSSVTLTATTV